MTQALTPTTIYGSILDGQDGSVYVSWFLTMTEAEESQRDADVGFGEDCILTIETYVGSNGYREAVSNA